MKESNIKILNDYAKWAILSGLSISSVNVYVSRLEIFLDFLIKRYKINTDFINIFILAKIDEELLIEFLTYLKYERDDAIATLNLYSAIIKNFYKWLSIKYYFIFKNKNDPTHILQDFHVKIFRLPKYVEINKALELQNIYNSNNSKNHLRNNAIITLFLNTGIRLSELVSLNIKDIDFNNKSFKVIGKGNIERKVFLTDKAINILKKYLKTRNDNYEPLFITKKGKRIDKRTVQTICKKAYELAGIDDKKYSTHTLRHTAATYMYRETKDILLVKNFLGHKSLSATEMYVHLLRK